MRTVEIAKVWIDESSRLQVTPALETGDDYAFIYRAAMGVSWDPESRSLCSTIPRDGSHADRFRQIVDAVASEYGSQLVLTHRTAWSGVQEDMRASIQAAALDALQ